MRCSRAPLTREDWLIWQIVDPRLFRVNSLYEVSVLSDRRDADLMFEAQDFPSRSVVYVKRTSGNVAWSEGICVRNGVDWP